MRGQIVAWYLGVLAILLFGLCLVQTVTLTGYFRSTTDNEMRTTVGGELSIIGPCFIRTSADLQSRAPALADLFGSGDVGDEILTPAGQVVARHALGPPGAASPLALSPLLIAQLIRPFASSKAHAVSRNLPPHCKRTASRKQPPNVVALRRGDLLLMATPLGSAINPLGYAIIGRSVAGENAMVLRARLILIFGAGSVLILASLVALPIMNRSLRPLSLVTRTAEAIAEGDLGQRANLSDSVDEVGRLGKAFDTMVDRLQTALAAATTSENRMRQFLADASHELRTPLTVLRGTSSVLRRPHAFEEGEMESALDAIHEETARLTALVDNLLTLSRLDAEQALDPHPVRVSSFLHAFVDRYGGAWPDRTIAIDDSEVDRAEVQVDSDALRRMLTNLVDNAARYSAPGKAITIGTRLDADRIYVTVNDEGPGLPPEDAERLFERFYRGRQSRARPSGGSGLGLAIVHALVQRSHGEIHIDTGPDRGTTVTILLPLMEQGEPHRNDLAAEMPRSAHSPAPAPGRRAKHLVHS